MRGRSLQCRPGPGCRRQLIEVWRGGSQLSDDVGDELARSSISGELFGESGLELGEMFGEQETAAGRVCALDGFVKVSEFDGVGFFLHTGLQGTVDVCHQGFPSGEFGLWCQCGPV